MNNSAAEAREWQRREEEDEKEEEGGVTHVMGGHDVQVVPVVGVEGHDRVDRLAGRQPQRPLAGRGHVGREGQL